jgi:hypothetical protein
MSENAISIVLPEILINRLNLIIQMLEVQKLAEGCPPSSERAVSYSLAKEGKRFRES